ncbi:MAG: hypothetical protein QUS14_18995 [Pyrinomonadaceae bacterium]|nr:hypothetical protein [Pyrinomonadaceae bacterium]
MKEENFVDRYRISWIAFVLSIISLGVVIYLKTVFVFDDVNFAQGLTTLSFFTAIGATILGLFSIRRWQGIVAVLVASVSLYFNLFGPIWAIS